jgi:hypothetical protein
MVAVAVAVAEAAPEMLGAQAALAVDMVVAAALDL